MAFVKLFFSFALFAVLYGRAKAYCSDKSDCPALQVCCKLRFTTNECAYSCVGKSCSYNSDCGGTGKYCCNNICRSSCSGVSCILHSDCGGDNEFCCDYSCQEGTCGLPSWAIVVIVLSVLGVGGTISGIVLCVYCAHRQRSPGLIVSSTPYATIPATSTAVVADSNVNYAQGPPPAYQPQQPVYQPPQQAAHQPPQQAAYQPPQQAK